MRETLKTLIALLILFTLGSQAILVLMRKEDIDIELKEKEVNLLSGNTTGGNIEGDTVWWENEYARLEVSPHTSTELSRHTQYANVTWKYPDNNIDLVFRFDNPLDTNLCDVWVWQNISHQVMVMDYGDVEGSYNLYNISDIQNISDPTEVDWGDIPSDFYRSGNASYLDEEEGYVYRNWIIGFDSFEWLNEEHTNATFNYTYNGTTGYHNETQDWFDWESYKSQFEYLYYGNKHNYYVQNVPVIQNKSYNLKWTYSQPANTNGKWELMAKLSSETIEEALSSDHYVMIDPWWNSDYQHFRLITVESDYIEEDLNDFPILVTLDNSTGDFNFHNGYDIAFVALDNTTQFNHEVEEFNNAGETYCWVEIGETLTSGSDYQFLIYYDNPSATGLDYQAESVWNSNYRFVAHCNNDGMIIDSTSYHVNFTEVGSPVYQQYSGIVGYGIKFNGDDACFENTTMPASSWSQMNIEVWHSPYSAHQADESGYLFDSRWSTTGPEDIRFTEGYGTTGSGDAFINGWFDDGGAEGELNSTLDFYNRSHYYVLNCISNQYVKGYRNTTRHIYDGAVSFNFGGLDNVHTIGDRGTWYASEKFVEGVLDEIRISDVVRNDSWVRATYHTVNQSTDFITLGPEEQGGGAWGQSKKGFFLFKNDKNWTQDDKGWFIFSHNQNFTQNNLGWFVFSNNLNFTQNTLGWARFLNNMNWTLAEYGPDLGVRGWFTFESNETSMELWGLSPIWNVTFEGDRDSATAIIPDHAWCNSSGTYEETIQINISVNSTTWVEDVSFWCHNLHSLTNSSTIGADNITVWVSTDNISFYCLGSFSHGGDYLYWNDTSTPFGADPFQYYGGHMVIPPGWEYLWARIRVNVTQSCPLGWFENYSGFWDIEILNNSKADLIDYEYYTARAQVKGEDKDWIQELRGWFDFVNTSTQEWTQNSRGWFTFSALPIKLPTYIEDFDDDTTGVIANNTRPVESPSWYNESIVCHNWGEYSGPPEENISIVNTVGAYSAPNCLNWTAEEVGGIEGQPAVLFDLDINGEYNWISFYFESKQPSGWDGLRFRVRNDTDVIVFEMFIGDGTVGGTDNGAMEVRVLNQTDEWVFVTTSLAEQEWDFIKIWFNWSTAMTEIYLNGTSFGWYEMKEDCSSDPGLSSLAIVSIDSYHNLYGLDDLTFGGAYWLQKSKGWFTFSSPGNQWTQSKKGWFTFENNQNYTQSDKGFFTFKNSYHLHYDENFDDDTLPVVTNDTRPEYFNETYLEDMESYALGTEFFNSTFVDGLLFEWWAWNPVGENNQGIIDYDGSRRYGIGKAGVLTAGMHHIYFNDSEFVVGGFKANTSHQDGDGIPSASDDRLVYRFFNAEGEKFGEMGVYSNGIGNQVRWKAYFGDSSGWIYDNYLGYDHPALGGDDFFKMWAFYHPENFTYEVGIVNTSGHYNETWFTMNHYKDNFIHMIKTYTANQQTMHVDDVRIYPAKWYNESFVCHNWSDYDADENLSIISSNSFSSSNGLFFNATDNVASGEPGVQFELLRFQKVDFISFYFYHPDEFRGDYDGIRIKIDNNTDEIFNAFLGDSSNGGADDVIELQINNFTSTPTSACSGLAFDQWNYVNLTFNWSSSYVAVDINGTLYGWYQMSTDCSNDPGIRTLSFTFADTNYSNTVIDNVYIGYTLEKEWVQMSSGWFTFHNNMNFTQNSTGFFLFSHNQNFTQNTKGFFTFTSSVNWTQNSTGWFTFSNNLNYTQEVKGHFLFLNNMNYTQNTLGFFTFSNSINWTQNSSGWFIFNNNMNFTTNTSGWFTFNNNMNYTTDLLGFFNFQNNLNWTQDTRGFFTFWNNQNYTQSLRGFFLFENEMNYTQNNRGWFNFTNPRNWTTNLTGWFNFSNVSFRVWFTYTYTGATVTCRGHFIGNLSQFGWNITSVSGTNEGTTGWKNYTGQNLIYIIYTDRDDEFEVTFNGIDDAGREDNETRYIAFSNTPPQEIPERPHYVPGTSLPPVEPTPYEITLVGIKIDFRFIILFILLFLLLLLLLLFWRRKKKKKKKKQVWIKDDMKLIWEKE